jgi:hypothetical protein
VIVGRRAVTLTLVVFFACAAPAGATTTVIGHIAPAGSSSNLCFECSLFQYSSAATSPSYVVPAGEWQPTSWRIRGGVTNTGHDRLQIYRPTATPDRFRLVAQTRERAVPPNRVSTFGTSVAVKAGDVLGLRTGAVPGDVPSEYDSTDNEDALGAVQGDPKAGDTVGPGGDHGYSIFPSSRLDVSVTLYRSPPETIITSHPPRKTTSRRPRFRFRSDAPNPVTFKCKLDGAQRFSTCSSPYSYRDLTRGSHVFRVRAIDGSADTDPSPARWTWRITG